MAVKDILDSINPPKAIIKKQIAYNINGIICFLAIVLTSNVNKNKPCMTAQHIMIISKIDFQHQKLKVPIIKHTIVMTI